MSKQFMSMLSLAQKAGAVRTGEYAVAYCIQEDLAKLVIVAKNAGPNTMKKFINKSDFYNMRIEVCQSKEILSWAIGKDNVSVLAITDENFSKKIEEIIDSSK